MRTENMHFCQEVDGGSFIRYQDLIDYCGLTGVGSQGIRSGWLMFGDNDSNRILFVAKRNVLTDVTWDRLNIAGCVFGERTIEIRDCHYKIRLLTGADDNPARLDDLGTGFLVEGSNHSEWSQLLYPLIFDDPYLSEKHQGPKGEKYQGPRNPQYSLEDLDLSYTPKYSWCQESITGIHPLLTTENEDRRIIRGGTDSTWLSHYPRDSTNNLTGWRPALELYR